MRIVPPTLEHLTEAAALIRAGEVVAYPTETVYGLACDPFSTTAIQRLFAAKGRAETNPVLLIAANIDQVIQVVSTISDNARTCADRYWPGPLSMLFPKSDRVP
ncbi:MAG: Sua5/YciO/YrdC/YwlC family protein, partial [Candidatus Hydrogenedentes bacterium]|nr:Sua5/YciO/YrdC/YwlC family protein [Candidatus Hydrogenedentota bacterium]